MAAPAVRGFDQPGCFPEAEGSPPPSGIYYVHRQESVTTEKNNMLSDLIKRFHHKPDTEPPDNGSSESAATEEPGSAGEPTPPEKLASDAELAAAFRHFGWQDAVESASAEAPAGELSDWLSGCAANPEEQTERPHMDVRELFSNLDHVAAQEIFTEEELHRLEGERTHVFSEEDMRSITEKAMQNKASPRTAPRIAATRLAEEDRRGEPAQKSMSEDAYSERDFRPIRRRRRYRTGLGGGLLYFGFVVCVSLILASVGWLAANDVLSLNKPYAEAEVYIGEEDGLDEIASELYNKGLIQYRILFRFFGTFMKADQKIDPGVYTLSTKQDYVALVRGMQQPKGWVGEQRATVKVLIPEGKTVRQTFQILAERGVCPYETLMDCAAEYEFSYEFLDQLPYGDATRLEGYLFPDTYEFYANDQPESVIDKFLDNFELKMSQELRERIDETGYSLHEILTVASLIEMEAGKDIERAAIASVIYNRLQSTAYPCLQIDATVQYALEERKETLSEADLAINSPYNTYLYAGLPPGPIANPGMASIRAAISPESTGYYFYALSKEGGHEFFSSYSQFEYFINSSSFGG